jgi:hypothetical protein
MDPITMDDEQASEIIRNEGVTHIGHPYQYRMNNKKKIVMEWEGLDNDEEEVDDICATRIIEDILHTKNERKTKGHGYNVEEGSPFYIRISVETTTPCATNRTEEEKLVNQQVVSGRIIFAGHGSSSRSASSTISFQVSTSHGGGSSTNFTMTGQDPTIRLP